MTEIKVSIVFFRDRGCYMARWLDPVTGKYKHESTGEDDEQKAGTYAAKLEERLNLGVHKPTKSVTWEKFLERFEVEYLESLGEKTRSKYGTVFKSFKKEIAVKSISSITAEKISKWQSELRKNGLEEVTIKGYLSYLRKALKWAKSQGMINEVPNINIPRRAKASKVMRGRPITGEEFDRLLKAVPKVVGDECAEDFKYFLKGMWWGGLRIGEALALTWNHGEFCLVEIEGHYYFRIQAEGEKGFQDRLLPVAPQFEQILPIEAPSSGYVFNPRYPQMRTPVPRLDKISRKVSKIGKKAGIVTDVKVEKDKKGVITEKKIYATSHDLRRGFGTRWAPLVKPKVLMDMMRHSSMETTLKYYVEGDAQETSKTLWDIVNSSGNKGGNKPEESEVADAEDRSETPEK